MRRKKIVLLFPILIMMFSLSSQAIDLDAINAGEDFRWGVIAYNKANYNDAIRSFERALSLKPNELLYQEWLGNALYRSGFISSAEEIWTSVLNRSPDPLLNNRLELLRLREGHVGVTDVPKKYVISGVLTGEAEDGFIFNRPSSLFPLKDGGFLASAFGSSEILSFDVNGAIRGHYSGGLEKFGGPFDVIQTDDGTIYLTEYSADHITVTNPLGSSYLRFGSRGRGDGEFLGPQFLAMDEDGYLYITDYGNHRVVKMDQEGNFILNFGGRSGASFSGLAEPTGIAIDRGQVYVADARRRSLFVFDTSGNYLTTLMDGQLVRPEGLSSGTAGELILVDDNQIFSFNIDMERMSLMADLSGANSRIMKAVRDVNGNILSVDFNGNRISFLTDISQVYTGLAIKIDRINTEEFPRVVVDLTVEDSFGNPMVGLSEKNFIFTELSEGRHNPDDHKLLFSGNRSKVLHSALMVDRSPEMLNLQGDIRKAVEEISDGMEGTSTLRTISVGEIPLVGATLGASRDAQIRSALGSAAEYTVDGRFDLALRLAAGEILSGRGHKSILYLSQGSLGPHSFDGYGILDLARFLKNNGIRFYVVSLTQDELAPELTYLCDETGGDSVFLYRPQGLKGYFDEMVEVIDGTYTLEYRSLVDGDFGRKYIPFQTEVLLYNRSGREKSGYFAPARY